jgi:hypothetical protein
VWQASDGTQNGPKDFTGPLPVSLLSFTAEQNENSVLLEWLTASEINNDYFEILRSQDGKSFESIQKINGVGNSNQLNGYTFIDKQPFKGQSYYRLLQVDFDGAKELHPVVSVVLKEEGSFNIFPNPASEKILINGLSAGDWNVKLFDLTGRLIDHYIINNEKGQIEVTLKNIQFTGNLLLYIEPVNGGAVFTKHLVIE